MEVSVRRITRDDWAAFRAIRLRALADAPDAFGITLGEAQPKPDVAWQDRAGGPGLLLIGFAGELPVAIGGLHAPEGSLDAYVWGMWVEPAWRGRGLAGSILDELLDWARRHDRAVSLHVTEGNDGARRLYEAASFEPTGEWEPLRAGSELQIERLCWRPA